MNQGQEQGTTAAPKPKRNNSTQEMLGFQELRDNMVIMNDGGFRAIVAAQSINFDLMSARERDGIELSYQDFLNSLTFAIQIYIHSQKVDIQPYIDKLAKIRANQENMLLGVLMDDYMEFIAALAQEANIMDKSFFIIIPYTIGDEKNTLGKESQFKLGELFNSTPTNMKVKIPADQYQRAKDELNSRADLVIQELAQIGIRGVRLKTKDIGQLYYNVYNPDTASRAPIGNFRDYTNNIVTTKAKNDGENMEPIRPTPLQPISQNETLTVRENSGDQIASQFNNGQNGANMGGNNG